MRLSYATLKELADSGDGKAKEALRYHNLLWVSPATRLSTVVIKSTKTGYTVDTLNNPCRLRTFK